MADETERPTIEVNGAEISESLYEFVTSIVVEQSVLVPDMFTLRILDPAFETFDSGRFSIGDEVSISYADDDVITVVTTSEITSIEVESLPSGLTELVVVGLGKAHRLARGSKVRIFEETTDTDIVKQIAGDYGLSTDIDPLSTQYPWLLQDQDDFSFLTTRALAVGCEWWVSGSTLHFKKVAKDGKSPEVHWPESLLSFKVRFAATDAVESVSVRGWDPTTQQAFVGESNARATADSLGTTAIAGDEATAKMTKLALPRSISAAPVGDEIEAEALAESMIKHGLAEGIDARGTTFGSPNMKAGSELKINGLGDKLTGTYLLTSVDHVFRAGERYLTRFRSGGRKEKSLVDLLGDGDRNKSGDIGMRLVAGIVTDTNDPDKAGRVKVNLSMLGDDAQSDWARMAAPGAGGERGLLIYPELGDEVLVGFEAGDPRKPLILGGLWSKKNVVPETADAAIDNDQVQAKGFFSRTGHKLVFNDGESPDEKSVAIELSDGQTSFYLGEDEVKIDTPKPLTITGQDDIKIESTSKGVTITATSISLKASGDLKLEGTNVSIKGSASVKVEGATTDVKAQGMVNVEAGGVASVKGSLLKLN